MIQEHALDQSALVAAIGRDVPSTAELDDVGFELALQTGEDMGSGLGNLWEKVKAEFRVLLCTDDPRYADVRANASVVSPNYTTVVVASISGALGAVIGVAAAAIAPLVGLLLLVVTRVGKNAICSLQWGA